MTAEIELARPRAASLPDKLAYAKALADSGLLPAQYRGKPANLLYAVEYGEMLGLAPMAAIHGIHVIEGKPSASAALISALVRRAGHRLRVTGNDQRAVAEIVRCDDPEFTFRAEWTLDRARQAGLLGKSVWKNYPAAMLKARALTEVARDACQEALSGLQYTPEELGAETNEDGEPIRATLHVVDDRPPAAPDWASKPAGAHERATGEPEPLAVYTDEEWTQLIGEAEKGRDAAGLRELWRIAKAQRPGDVELRERITAAAQRAAAASDEPDEQDEPVDAEIVDDDEPLGVTVQQHRHMHALWGKTDLSRDDRLTVTAHLIGRDVTSSSELTGEEADLIIERLRAFDTLGRDQLAARVQQWLREAHRHQPDPDLEPREVTSIGPAGSFVTTYVQCASCGVEYADAGPRPFEAGEQ